MKDKVLEASKTLVSSLKATLRELVNQNAELEKKTKQDMYLAVWIQDDTNAKFTESSQTDIEQEDNLPHECWKCFPSAKYAKILKNLMPRIYEDDLWLCCTLKSINKKLKWKEGLLADEYLALISYVREVTNTGCSKINKIIIDNGIFDTVWNLMTKELNEDLTHHTSWILINLTKGKSDIMFKYLLSNHLLFEHFDKMLQSKNTETVENALWSFANLACEGQQLIKTMLKTSLIDCIQVQVKLDHDDRSIPCAWAWCLANLMKYKNKSQELITNSINLLNTLLLIQDNECWQDTLDGLKNLVTIKEASLKLQGNKFDLLYSTGVI